ncbi:anti-sigma factor family protein [Lacisediminihabitans changchengi]|uniref:Zf-HC2 domain-containing protein n=1 Tax=Lacisediminihabitans changchengi TaxID=2787634 RepID=A0A934SN65_9MICO|nr:zf-HC2 domain-containing protein [Lacisediminihabitans changchengi]MBK4346043.1 zf-HC2 domain-containing protein [Lacisediminihabitans changchengi]
MSDDVYSDWDAAYVLGALSAEERGEYERHLAECPSCAAALAELAGIPGLLATVPAEEAIRETPRPIPVPDTLWPRMLRSARRRRLRTRAAIGGGAVLVAAAVAALVFALPTLTAPLPAPAPSSTVAEPVARTVALKPVVPSALRASIRVVSEGWGTRIDMDCSYGLKDGATPGYGGGQQQDFDYAMYVTDARGRSIEVATWSAGPGTSAEPSGTTSLAADQIRLVEVRSTRDGTVLLRTSL